MPVRLSEIPDIKHPRCPKHEGVVRAVPALRECPQCRKPTFREDGVCSRCDPEVPPLRSERLSSRAPTRRMRKRVAPKRRPRRAHATRPTPKRDTSMPRHHGRGRRTLRPFGAMDGRIWPALAREIASLPEPERVINGLRLHPDEPRMVAGPASPWQIGNRTRVGVSVSAQHPARDKALALMTCPGEWEVLAFYQHSGRIKAAVWYLRRRVAPTLPPGRWEFARCPWERAAVMGRFTPV